MDLLIGIFLILHGLVHLLYAGHALALFELEPGFVWPDNALLFRRLSEKRRLRLGITVLLVLAALGFVVSGARYLLEPSWGHLEILVSAGYSTLLFLLLWDGSRKRLHTQGAIAILINLAIISTVCYMRSL